MTRVLTYLFPFILIAMEFGLRLALRTELGTFAGPALASASGGLLISLTAPKRGSKRFTDPTQQEVENSASVIRSNSDEAVRAFALLLLLLSIAAWVWCVILAQQRDTEVWLGWPRPLALGLWISYVSS